MFTIRTSFSLALLLAVSVTSSTTHAQCSAPDNLSGPCCTPAQLNIPAMPGFALPALGICWDDCAPTSNESFVEWTAPVPMPDCGQFLADVRVSDPLVGVPVMFGTATIDYTRTWEEVDPVTLERYQVWRHTAKVMLFDGGVGLTACPRPPCIDVFQQAFFYGYVDWALNCDTGVWSNSTMLFHNCDLFIHNALSAQPIPSHPSTTYGVVAPHTTLNPFVPTTFVPVPSGGLVAEAVRSTSNPVAGLCNTEEPIAGGNLLPLVYGCLCGGSTSFQQSANLLSGASLCGSSFGSVFVPSAFPTIPWIHMVSTSIGTWTGSTYPGPERVLANEGLFTYQDGCTGVPYLEVHYGATTFGGWPVLTAGLPQTFVDLADNYTVPISTPPTLPVVGAVMPTDHLIYVNTP